MTTLYISEFSNLPIVSNGAVQIPDSVTWLADQTVAIGGTSTPSAAFNVNTRFVVLVADAPCSIAWTPAGEATVAATASNLRIPANVPQKFGVSGGGKVSVITNS